MDILKTMDEKAFWGAEFLTWLWYLSETSGDGVAVTGQMDVSLWIEDLLVLEGSEAGVTHTVRSGDVAGSAEAAAALYTGKKVRRARFGLTQGELAWSFTLDSHSLDVKSLKIPHVEPEEEDADAPEALVFLRMNMVRRLISILDVLFADFAKLRISPEWEKETAGEISKWIKEKADR